MDREMININANLVKEVELSEFERDGEKVDVANFTLIKKYGKGKEYINCSVYPCLWIFQRKQKRR